MWSLTARTSSGKTLCCAGVGPSTAESHRRWAGPQCARPGERLSCLRKQAVRRNLGALRALRGSARARVRSHMASSSPVGPETAGRAPERARRASCRASLRSVLPRAPACLGRREGAPPSRRRLCAGAPARARSPRGPPQRPRGGGWLALASDGGVARGHPGVSRWGPERCPRHQTLGRQTPPPGKPCGHPGRSSVCETATGWPAALSVAVATAGGSGCGVSEPAVHWGATSRQRKS